MHSSTVFAFDANGHGRLVITDVFDTDAVIADLKQLIDLQEPVGYNMIYCGKPDRLPEHRIFNHAFI